MELTRLKQLLGIDESDTSKDVSLSFVISDVEELIKNYCHIEEVPVGLLNTAYRMAIDLYRNEKPGQEEAATGAVSSISEGDTSISFKPNVDDNFKDTLLKNYRVSLNCYRRVVFQ